MADQDGLFDDDTTDDEALEAYERRREDLQNMLSDYFDDLEVSPLIAAQLLLEAAISYRVSAYGISVENPSAAGLKLELDRFARQIAELVRGMKKNAEACIADIKKARAEADAEAEEAEESEGADDEDEGGTKQ